MRRALLYFVLFFQLIACLGPHDMNPDYELLNEKSSLLYQELSEIHDTAMLLMSPIAGVKIQLRNHMNQSEDRTDSILIHLTELKKAEDWMMRWMNAFRNIDLDQVYYQTQPKDSIRAYLQAEKEQVIQLHDFMQLTLKNAKDFNRSIESF